MNSLLQIVHNSHKQAFIKTGVWAISNLIRETPWHEINFAKDAIPVLCAILKKETSIKILIDVAWPLSFLSEKEYSVSEIFISTGVLRHLVGHLK